MSCSQLACFWCPSVGKMVLTLRGTVPFRLGKEWASVFCFSLMLSPVIPRALGLLSGMFHYVSTEKLLWPITLSGSVWYISAAFETSLFNCMQFVLPTRLANSAWVLTVNLGCFLLAHCPLDWRNCPATHYEWNKNLQLFLQGLHKKRWRWDLVDSAIVFTA